VSILAAASNGLGTPFAVVPLINEWSVIFDGVVAVVDGRCCLSLDGRFSLSFVIDGRVLDETTFDANVDWVFEVSVTPLLVEIWPIVFSVVSV
jgi:hypothetical protein